MEGKNDREEDESSNESDQQYTKSELENEVPNTNTDQLNEDSEYIAKVYQEISHIKEETENLEEKINSFTSETDIDELRRTEEQLMQMTLKLDNMDSKGNEVIRDSRRYVIRYIQMCMDIVDAKINMKEQRGDQEN